jgi:hypothetical protein
LNEELGDWPILARGLVGGSEEPTKPKREPTDKNKRESSDPRTLAKFAWRYNERSDGNNGQTDHDRYAA